VAAQPRLGTRSGIVASYTRLAIARQVYGPPLSIAQIVSGIYEHLDELQKLYGGESIQEVLAGIIERKKRLNRMIELQSKVALNVHELREFQVLKQQFKQYVNDLSMQKKHATIGHVSKRSTQS
jgi:predicted CopG family antitoxin